MSGKTDYKDKIFSVNAADFDDTALEIFRFQALHNQVYSKYLEYLKVKPDEIKKVAEIPFLPIELFKTQNIFIPENQKEPNLIFESSGTTGIFTSRHFISDPSIYKKSIEEGFWKSFGEAQDYIFLALLPSYLERGNSSLVYMMNYLMEISGNNEGGFYLDDFEALNEIIQKNKKEQNKKIFLAGVGFALLDFAEKHQPDLSGIIVMETGGMKGRRKEMIREELHDELKTAFKLDKIYSEYGMTELLSQAYTKGENYFYCPPWMKVLIREANDPFSYVSEGASGGINVIDLANIYSCSFIATQDLGRLHKNGSFEVLGRFDSADIRGCSLLYE